MISVVTATYNRRRCVEEAIDSSLRELPNAEIVVVDDASTDHTSSLLRARYRVELATGQIQLLRLADNVGVTGAKNAGYAAARNSWIIFLDSDDHFIPGAGRAIEAELQTATEFSIVFFRCRTHFGTFVGTREGERRIIDLATYLRHTSFGEALIAINKRRAGETGPYETKLRGYEGLGCARVIRRAGPALLSNVVGRTYVTEGADRLSTRRSWFRRMPRLAKGHATMILEFGFQMGPIKLLNLGLKAGIYYVVGSLYNAYLITRHK